MHRDEKILLGFCRQSVTCCISSSELLTNITNIITKICFCRYKSQILRLHRRIHRAHRKVSPPLQREEITLSLIHDSLRQIVIVNEEYFPDKPSDTCDQKHSPGSLVIAYSRRKNDLYSLRRESLVVVTSRVARRRALLLLHSG